MFDDESNEKNVEKIVYKKPTKVPRWKRRSDKRFAQGKAESKAIRHILFSIICAILVYLMYLHYFK